MNRKSALLLAAILSTIVAVAQEGGPSVSQVSQPTVVVTPGRTSQVTLTFRVAGNFHINSHKPLDELLLPTELKLSPPTEIMISKVTYPEGELLNFPFSPETKLSVYSGDFEVTASVKPTSTAPAGTFRVHGDLKFQACNDRQCFPPKKVPIQFDVKVQRAKKSHRG